MWWDENILIDIVNVVVSGEMMDGGLVRLFRLLI